MERKCRSLQGLLSSVPVPGAVETPFGSGFARSSDVHRRIVVRYENRFVFGVSELLAVPVSARQALTDTQSNKLVGARRFELPAPASRRHLVVYK